MIGEKASRINEIGSAKLLASANSGEIDHHYFSHRKSNTDDRREQIMVAITPAPLPRKPEGRREESLFENEGKKRKRTGGQGRTSEEKRERSFSSLKNWKREKIENLEVNDVLFD